LCERQDALYVEVLELRAVAIDLNERQFLAQAIAPSFVRLEVDRAREDERIVEAIELLLNRLRRRAALQSDHGSLRTTGHGGHDESLARGMGHRLRGRREADHRAARPARPPRRGVTTKGKSYRMRKRRAPE
jgi:hypothetical protein